MTGSIGGFWAVTPACPWKGGGIAGIAVSGGQRRGNAAYFIAETEVVYIKDT